MSRRKVRIAWLISLVFVAFLLTAFAFIALEADHDCAGNSCDICEQIARLHALIHQTFLLPTGLAVGFLWIASRAGNKAGIFSLSRPLSLVTLKVRMDD